MSFFPAVTVRARARLRAAAVTLVNWILATGAWSDASLWNDSQNWKDN